MVGKRYESKRGEKQRARQYAQADCKERRRKGAKEEAEVGEEKRRERRRP